MTTDVMNAADVAENTQSAANAAASQDNADNSGGTDSFSKKKRPLISVRSLKQYFPVRGKRKLFVRANDGVTLDIFENETLGVVGESGCGKSTLGRVMLQLFRQTDGETLYYGRSLESLAPVYVLKIYKNLEKRCTKSKQAMEKLRIMQEEYDKLFDKTGKSAGKDAQKLLYLKLNELNEAKKVTLNEYQALVRLVGGFYVARDYMATSRALLEYYRSVVVIRKMRDSLIDTQLKMRELKFLADKPDGEAYERRRQNLREKVESKIITRLDAAQKERDAKYKVVCDLREAQKDDPEFMKYEAMREDCIDMARLKYSEMRHLRKDLQLIFQDPYSSLNPRLTVGQIVSEGPITHKQFKTTNDRMQEYTIKVMEDCGLAPYMIHRYPHQFSGGQRQRIGIARALSVSPKFVVCDEAVSALDVSIQSQIINLLKDLKDKENLTYMFISHDLSVVKYISDRIAVMYLGNIVELASSKALFDKPLHPYTTALLSAIPTTDPDSRNKKMDILEGDIPSPVNPPPGCKFNTRCKDCMEICYTVVPEWKEYAPEHFVACHKY